MIDERVDALIKLEAAQERVKELEARLDLAEEFKTDFPDAVIRRCWGHGPGKDDFKWKIERNNFNWTKENLWEWEPLPSSRDDEFYSRARYDSYEEALAALAKAKTIKKVTR